MKISFALTLITFAATLSAQADSFDDPVCNNVCNTLINPATNQITTITGDQKWSAADDAWCTAHPFSVSAPPMSQGAANNDNICQYHNSQVLSYCIAYDKIQKAQGMELPLLLLDVTGAGLCGATCADPALSAGFYAACRIDSTAASAMELLDALLLTTDPTAEAVSALLGGVGIAANFLEYHNLGDLKSFTSGAQGDHAQRNACITAAAMAVAAGLRTYNLTHQQQSKQSACSDVKSLLSTSPVIGVASPTPAAPVAIAGGGGSVGPVTNLGPNALLDGGAHLASSIACAQNGLSSCSFANPGAMSAATDGGVLSSSGLDQVAAQQLAQSNLSGVNPASPNTQGMLGKVLGDTSTQTAANLLKIEAAAEQNAKNLEGSTAFSKGAAVADIDVKKGGFGAFDFAAPSAGTAKSEIGFQRKPSATGDGDIWHAGYSGSIFQIVSSKIVESKERVQPLDWTTPLNRALMGLPQLKGAQK